MRGRFSRCALVALVALGGCGDDDTASPSTAQSASTSSTTTSTPTSVTTAAEGSTLVIPDDVFGFVPDGTGSYESIVVEADADDVVVEALRRAAARFMLVTDDGTEHPDDASVERSGLYSPNYVADPQIKTDGVRMYVDCKGVIEPSMAVTFRQILREELLRGGVTNATVRPDVG